MVYRRPGRKSYTFQGRTETGWKQVGTLTRNKSLAGRIETMWGTLAEARAWDVLGRVTSGSVEIGALYDVWTASKYDVGEIRRRLSDVDLDPLVTRFLEIHAPNVKPDTLEHIRFHLRHLIPDGKQLLASSVTTDFLTEALGDYKGKRNTIRKVHSDWSVFFDYLTRVKHLYPSNPMDSVTRPTVEESPIKFYELDVIERIVGAQPTEARRVVMALIYGAALEVSVALGVARADVNLSTREVRAPGTKAHSRDRICRVNDWAWPTIEGYVRPMLPTAQLFPPWTRWTVSDWHRETVKKLKLSKQYPLHSARDAWAVRAARAGTPIAVIQAQLGHGSPSLTLTKYGRFLPSASDRAKWEKAATKYEAQRRKA
jgi:integrase